MGIFSEELKLKKPEDLEQKEVELQNEIQNLSQYKTINTSEKGINLSPENWGCLYKYIIDDSITDINFNGKDLWLIDINGINKKVYEEELTKSFIDILMNHIANSVSKQFNNTEPILEAETKDLRISALHESVAPTGLSFCIRKTPEFVRIETESALRDKYATKEELAFLINCINAKMNIAICGEPGVGKTELAKYLSSFIPDKERVITIEDTLEWHYQAIHPQADTVSLQVSDKFTYFDAIKACLRQDPKWLMLSEARGEEVAAYIQQLSTGTNGITTLHCDAVKKIPDRLVNMSNDGAENRKKMEYYIYNFLSIGVLVNKKPGENGKEERFIDQIGVFGWEGEEKINRILFNDQIPFTDDPEKFISRIPIDVMQKFKRAGIENVLKNKILEDK